MNESKFSERTNELVEMSKNDDEEIETDESLSFLTRVVETIKKSEESMLMENCEENSKSHSESNENLQEMKISENMSIDSWAKVVGDSSESNESCFLQEGIVFDFK